MSYLLVKRKKTNKNNLIFNDKIYLVSDEFDKHKPIGSIMFEQVCDSIADNWITQGYGWSKKNGNPESYTIIPGVYKIKPSTYKNNPAIHIIRPVTKWYKWSDFTLPHKIHRVNLPKNGLMYLSRSKDDKLYKTGYSGGCIVLPNPSGIIDILDFINDLNDSSNYIKYPSHLKIVEVN